MAVLAKVLIDFGSMKVEWKYDREKKEYMRYEMGFAKRRVRRRDCGKNVACKSLPWKFWMRLAERRLNHWFSQAMVLTYGLALRQVAKKTRPAARVFGPDTKEVVFDPGALGLK